MPLSGYAAQFYDERILEWRNKYLRYELLASQIKKLRKCTRFLDVKVESNRAEQACLDSDRHAHNLCSDMVFSEVNSGSASRIETGNDLTFQQIEESAKSRDHREQAIKILQVSVVSATNLPHMNTFGKCDAFCKIEFCDVHASTSVKKNS